MTRHLLVLAMLAVLAACGRQQKSGIVADAGDRPAITTNGQRLQIAVGDSVGHVYARITAAGGKEVPYLRPAAETPPRPVVDETGRTNWIPGEMIFPPRYFQMPDGREIIVYDHKGKVIGISERTGKTN